MKITRIDAFQVRWTPDEKPTQHSAFVRIHTDDGIDGIGEASPMQGGLASLGIIRHDLAPALIGKDPLDHAVLLDTLLHTCVKLGPEGALTGALAALDIAMWDIKGKLTGLPIYKLLGGAWRTALPFYASIGGNGDRSLDDVLRVVEARLKDKPAAIKIRFDNPSHAAGSRHSRRHRQGARGAQAGRRWLPAGVRRQQRLHHRRRDPCRSRTGGTRLSGGSRNRCSTTTSRRWARSRVRWTSPCRPASRPTRWRRWPI